MDSITRSTRSESYIKRPVFRKGMILQVLKGRQLTARQIANELGFTDLNYVKPRLSELRDEGRIRTVRKALDLETNRNVAVWEIIEEEETDNDY